jgi:peptide/nickel transport system permease protein
VLRFAGRQLVHLIVVLFGAVTITFVALRLSGNPVDALLPANATAQERQILIQQLGLNRGLADQYGHFLGQVVRGDMGNSIINGQSAIREVTGQLASSLVLAGLALAVAAVVGIALGVLSAERQGGWLDRLCRAAAAVGQAAPSFWLGLILIIVFAVRLRLFPASGMGGPRYLVLPVLTLAVAIVPYVMRLTRTTMLGVLDAEFMRFHKAKGLRPAAIIYRHGLKNCLPPVITLLGLQAGPLLGGVVIIEYVFGRSGVGSLLISSIYNRDYPVVQVAVLVIVAVVVLANVAADLAVAALDPRVRLGGRAA